MRELREKNATGTVTTYIDDDGYGFLSTLDVKDGKTTDVFFHISDVDTGEVKEGWRFEFDVFSSRKGFHAENMEILDKGSEGDESHSDEERFLRSRTSEHDDAKYSSRTRQKKTNDKEDEDEEENKSPFDDDLTGSKNDLI